MFSMEDLWQEVPDDGVLREANAPPTVPSGKYMLQIDRYEPRVADDRSPYPGRKTVHASGKLTENGQSKGRIFLDLAWDKWNGEVDRALKLYSGLAKALKMEGQAVGGVLEQALLYPVSVYVTETFTRRETDGKSSFVSAKTASDRESLLRDGYVPRNYVQNVSAVK